jgi:hypothetical protein
VTQDHNPLRNCACVAADAATHLEDVVGAASFLAKDDAEEDKTEVDTNHEAIHCNKNLRTRVIVHEPTRFFAVLVIFE